MKRSTSNSFLYIEASQGHLPSRECTCHRLGKFALTTFVVQIDNTNNVCIAVELKSSLCNRSFHRILGSEDIVKFLELHHISSTLRKGFLV